MGHDPEGVGSFFMLRAGWVRSATYESGKFPPKSQFLSYRVKNISLGWLKKYPGQMRYGPLFTGDEKYMLGSGRVGSGPNPNKNVEKQIEHDFQK